MKRLITPIAFAVFALSPESATAKRACYPLEQIERALDSEYGEKRHFSGRESEGVEYRLYVNAKTGSWSWVGIPTGTQIGCLIFAGMTQGEPPGSQPSLQPQPPAAQF